MAITFGHPTDRRPPFRFSAYTRVGFSDTDAQGIVYYGRYLPYFDYARVEYARHLGVLTKDLQGCEFVMRACEVVYEAPARFDDLLEVFTRTSRMGRTSMTVELCAVRLDDEVVMCTADQTLVLVDPKHKGSVPIPDDFRQAIAAFEGEGIETAVAR